MLVGDGDSPMPVSTAREFKTPLYRDFYGFLCGLLDDEELIRSRDHRGAPDFGSESAIFGRILGWICDRLRERCGYEELFQMVKEILGEVIGVMWNQYAKDDQQVDASNVVVRLRDAISSPKQVDSSVGTMASLIDPDLLTSFRSRLKDKVR